MRKIFFYIVISLSTVALHAQEVASLDSVIESAVKWRQLGNPAYAATLLGPYLADEKPSQRVIYELAAAHFDMGNTTLAQSQSERAAKIGGDYTFDAMLLSARCYDLHGYYKQAVRTYKLLINDARNGDGKANYYFALMLYHQHKLDDAMVQAQNSILKNKAFPDVHYLLASIMAEKGERFHAMMPLYYYLLIADDDDSMRAAYKQLIILWKHGSQTISPLRKAVKPSSFNDKIEAKINEIASQDSIGKLSGREAIESLFNHTNLLLKYLTETSEYNLDFWQVAYTDFFVMLPPRNFLHPFIYHISNVEYHTEVLAWIAENGYLYNEFGLWMSAQ